MSASNGYHQTDEADQIHQQGHEGQGDQLNQEGQKRRKASGSSATRIGNEPDYYAVLGIRANASEHEIKQEFRRLAKLWHPDHFTAAPPDLRARAERRMQALNRAYAVLSDPVRKVAYDQSRRGPDAVGSRSAYWPTATYGKATFDFAESPIYGNRENSWMNASHNPNSAGNPNGAGMVGGTLCLILALGTLWRISIYGLVVGLGPVLGLAAFIALLILAGYLFDTQSPVARAVRNFLEHDPRLRWRTSVLRQQQDSRQYASFSPDPEPTAFELLVDEALAGIPDQFHSYLENVVVRVKADPSPDELERMKVRPCNLLLGLYEGLPLTYQGARGHPPEVITIFQQSIESYCHNDPDRIRYQVRATVFHELAHHFGMSHEEMPAWVK